MNILPEAEERMKEAYLSDQFEALCGKYLEGGMLMGTLILFYSYSGNTKRIAQELSAQMSADIAEIVDVNKPSKLKAYTLGCFAAMRGKSWPIMPIAADLSAFDHMILLTPVWAGNAPPAVNEIWELLPGGMSFDVKMVSASGKSKCKERINTALKAKNCVLKDFEEIKA